MNTVAQCPAFYHYLYNRYGADRDMIARHIYLELMKAPPKDSMYWDLVEGAKDLSKAMPYYDAAKKIIEAVEAQN